MDEGNIIKPKEGSVLDKFETVLGVNPQPNTTAAPSEMHLMKLQQMFDIQNPSTRERDMMTYMYQFFDKAGVQDMNELSLEVARIQRKLGNSPYGMSTLGQLYNYIRTLNNMYEYKTLQETGPF